MKVRTIVTKNSNNVFIGEMLEYPCFVTGNSYKDVVNRTKKSLSTISIVASSIDKRISTIEQQISMLESIINMNEPKQEEEKTTEILGLIKREIEHLKEEKTEVSKSLLKREIPLTRRIKFWWLNNYCVDRAFIVEG